MTTPEREAATILVVEDDDDTRDSIVEVLEEHGYRVVAKRDGREALAYVRGNPPAACIVMDLSMPNMDGWNFAAELGWADMPAIPIVVLTAADPQWGYPLRARHILRKPLGADALAVLVADAIAKPG